MVVYSIVALTGLRAFTLDYILVPLAQFAGVSKRKEKLRFAEQAWVLIYDSIFWSLGMVRLIGIVPSQARQLTESIVYHVHS